MKHLKCILLFKRYRWHIVQRNAFRIIEKCNTCGTERVL